MKNKTLAYFTAAITVILILAVFNFGKKGKTVNQNDGKMQVSASFYPMYFFSTEIGGEKTKVFNLTPAGSEPHDYELTPQDLASIENSKMLVLNGGGLEVWGDKIKENLKGKNKEIILAGEELVNREIVADGEKIRDPHVWLSPQLAKKMADKITDGFIKIDPENSGFYKQNNKTLQFKLDDLDNKYKSGLKTCRLKEIVTSHAAFGYLAESYGLKQTAISGISPDEEPSAKQLALVAKQAKESNIKYIFFESLVSPKLSETIASEIGAKTLVLNPIEGLTDDEIKSGKNYITVMEDNLANLKTALECK